MVKKTAKEEAASSLKIAEELFIHDKVIEALPHFQALAEKGEGRAFYFLGEYYRHGWAGLAADEDLASRYYKEGRKKKDPLCCLALAFGFPAGSKKREEKIWQVLPDVTVLGEAGDIIAMDSLGKAYKALGGEDMAWLWIERAAKCSYWMAILRQAALTDDCPRTFAQIYEKAYELQGDHAEIIACELGNYYSIHRSNDSLAASWYKKSIAKGYVPAMLGLADLYSKSVRFSNHPAPRDEEDYIQHFFPNPYEKDMVEWYQKVYDMHGKEAGTAAAHLGDYYEKCKMYKKAFPWYQKSADENNGDGMLSLGWCYYDGNGVKKDRAKALNLFQKVYETHPKQAPFAARSLALHYKDAGDETNALFWYQRGAKAGDAYCAFELACAYGDGTLGLEENIQKSREWYQKTFELDEPEINGQAACWAGYCYEKEGDYENARKWYKEGMERGFGLAMCFYARGYLYGRGTAKNRRNAMEWFQRAFYSDCFDDETKAFAAWGISTILKSQDKIKEAEKFKKIALRYGAPPSEFEDK